MADLRRNQWPIYVGISGRFGSEYANGPEALHALRELRLNYHLLADGVERANVPGVEEKNR